MTINKRLVQPIMVARATRPMTKHSLLTSVRQPSWILEITTMLYMSKKYLYPHKK
jgi:hypothetical protein